MNNFTIASSPKGKQTTLSLSLLPNVYKIMLAMIFSFLLMNKETIGQNYYNMSSGNYNQAFTAWSGYATNWNGLAVLSTGSIPVATKTTAATTILATINTGSAIGYNVASSTSLVFLATGNDNANAVACDLNLNFTGRTAGTLSFDAATVFNSSGDKVCNLKVYYSTDSTNWTEITGTNLPYAATNNVAGSAAISVTLPAAISSKSNVKLRFYCYGAGGATGSRAKISIDNVAITSTSAAATPTISGAATATAFTTTYGTASTAQTFTITASNLTDSLVAIAPTGFEVSKDSLNYSDSVKYVSTSTSVRLSIRLKSTATVAGTYNSKTIVLSSTGATSINITTASASNAVSRKALTITAQNQSVVYGTAVSAVTGAGSYVATGFVNSENSSVITGSATYTTTYTSTTAAGTAGVTITPVVTNLVAANYSFSAVNGAITITPSTASITVTGSLTAFSTSYGTATAGQKFTVSGSGLTENIALSAPSGFQISTDSITYSSSLSLTQTAGVVSTSGIWVRIPATIIPGTYAGDITISSNGASSRVVTIPSSTVSQATLTVAGATAADKTYDGNTNAVISGGTLSGIIGTDNVALSTTGTFASANAGTAIGVTLVLTGTRASYYTLTQPGLTANISKANQAIVFNALAPKYIGDADFALTATSASSTENPITYSSSNTGVATVVSGMVHIVGVGTTTITASQIATNNFNAATSVDQSLLVSYGLPSLTTFETPFKQFFDGIGSSDVATIPTGFKFGADWSTGTSVTTKAAGTIGTGILTGTSSGGNYNFANGDSLTSADRAIGFLFSSNFSTPNSIVLKITNNTGAIVNTLNVAFDFEKYRSGQREFNSTFFHGATSAPNIAATAGDSAFAADLNNTTVYNPPLTGAKNFTLSGLSIANGADYYFRWTLTGVLGSSNGQAIGIDNVSITARAVPVVTTPTVTNISTSSATLGANVTSAGSTSMTERGTVYKTSAGVTATDNPLAEGNVSTGVFTQSRTLQPETHYYYKGYATNSVGTGLSPEGDFYTLSNAPVIQASGLSGSPLSSTQILLNWSTAYFPTGGATVKKYLLLSATYPNVPVFTGTNGNAPSVDANTVIVDQLVSADVASASVIGLGIGVTYNFLLIPYTWDGVHAATYNYLTLNAPTASAATSNLPPPVLSAPTVSNITNSSAVLGATIDSDGDGSGIAQRGTIYSTTSPVTIDNNTLDEGGTSTGAFTQLRNDLQPQTKYYFAGWASNGNGSIATSAQGSFYTFANAPANAVSNVTANTISGSQVNLTWSPSTFPTSGATVSGYVLIRAVYPNTPTLINSNGQPATGDANTTVSSINILGSSTSVTATGLAGNTQYNFSLIPYTWDGLHDSTYSYYNLAAPVASATTFAPVPANRPTSISLFNITCSGMQVRWNRASGGADGYIVLKSNGLIAPNTVPVSGVVYSVGSTLGNATVVYTGADSTVIFSNLPENTYNNFTVFSYNGSGANNISYLTSSSLNGGNYTPLPTAPVATSATSIGAYGFTANWNAANCAANGYKLDVSTFANFYDATVDSVTVASEGFENALTLFTSAGTGARYNTGSTNSSSAIDYPASTPFASQGSYGFGVAAGTDTLTSAGINTNNLVNPQLSFKLAAISNGGGSTNGLDQTDLVNVYVSPNGGDNWFLTSTITGNNNALWGFNATGTASTPFDGDNTAVTFSAPTPSAINANGYSTVTITNLPNVSNLKVRIIMKSDGGPELWEIDQFSVTGRTPACVAPYNNYAVSGTTQVVTGLNPSTQYYYRVRAVGSGSSSSYSSNTIPVLTAGNYPTNLTFTNVTCNAMTLNWIPGTSSDGSIILQTSGTATPSTAPTNGTAYTAGNAIGNATVVYVGSATTFTASSLTDTTKYSYTIYSYAGTGAATAYVSTSVSGNQFTRSLSTPVATSATNVAGSSFTANWNTTNCASSYLLYVYQTSSLSPIIAAWTFPTSGQSTFTDSTLSNANNYGKNSFSVSPANTTPAISNVAGFNTTVTLTPTRAALTTGWNTANKYWQVTVNTTGATAIKVSSAQKSSGTGPRDFKLQYKIRANGTWTDVTTITLANDSTTGILTNVALPAESNNLDSLYIRWLNSSTTSVNNSTTASGGTSYIDNIVIRGSSAVNYVSGYNGLVVNGTSANVTGLSSNSTYYYHVVASNASGATTASSNVITVTTPLVCAIAANASSNSPVCTGATIQLNASATGANGAVTYSWSGPSAYASSTQNPTITNSSSANAGTYTVTVTDAAACTSTASTTVAINSLPTAGITNNTGTTVLTCSTTAISVSATGGTSYSWSGSLGTLADASITAPGTYTVTVTNASGCTSTASITVTSNTTAPTAGITNNTGSTVLTCSTTAINVTATGGTSYVWSNSLGTAAAQSLTAAGTYTVTATGANGCTSTASITVTSNTTAPTAGITNNTGSTELTCTRTAISVTATGGTSYVWSNSLGTAAAQSLTAAGTYTVTATGANGCTSTASITLTSNTTAPTAGITNNTGSTELTCSTTAISVTATGGTSYVWSNSLGNAAAQSLTAAGTYTVTATGANGCTSTASITLTSNTTAPTAGITNNTGTTVLTCSTTAISVTATGGTSYSWSGSLGTLADASITAPGTYTVTVTNAIGCTSTASITVTSNTTAPSVIINNNSESSELSCSTPVLNVQATGGVSYSWNNGLGNAATAAITTGGTYTVTATGANGCTSTASITVVQNTTPPTVNITNNTGTTELNCSTTSISVTASGGVGYAWSNGLGNLATANITTAGSYTVTVTSANGCTSTAGITVTSNTTAPTGGITNNTGSTELTCTRTAISVTATGGTSYSWSNSLGSAATQSLTASGTYTVTVTGDNGCTSTAGITITSNNTIPTAGITNNTGSTVLNCTTNLISVTATGGVSYSWNNSLGSAATQSLTSAGTYTVTVTGANGCTSTAGITVTSNTTAPTAGITNNTGSTQLTCTRTSISVTATGGGTYAWTGGLGSSSTVSIVDPGTYTVTVTSTNGCTSTASVIITQSAGVPNVGYTASSMSVCAGSPVTLSGTGADSYSWNNGVSDGVPFIPTSTTSYTVTGTVNANGCSNSTSVTITVISRPQANISGTTSICIGSSAALRIDLTGTGPWNGTLSNGSSFGGNTSPILVYISPVSTTTYTVTSLADATCTSVSGDLTGSATITVNNIATSTDTIVGTRNACIYSASSTLDATYSIAANNATGYTWSVPTGASIITGNGTNAITVHFASTFTTGTISVTIGTACGTPITKTTGTITKTVSSAPASITGPTNVCSYLGTTTQATYTAAAVAGAIKYSWTLPATVTIVSANTDSSTINVTFDVAYVTTNFSVKAVVGCGTTTAKTLSVAGTASAPIAVPASRCGPGIITVGATPGSGETIDWYSAATGGTLIRSGSTTLDSNITATRTFYAASRNIANGCVSATRTAVIATYNALPSAVSTAPGVSSCGSASLTLTATAPAGTTLSWFADSSTTGTALTTGLTYVTPTLSVTTKYFVASQSAAGCFATTLKSVTATINDVPGSPAVTTTQSRCGTGSITLTATAPTGSAVWFRDASTTTALTTATTATVTYATPATSSSDSTYYVASKSSAGCFSSRVAVLAQIIVSVNAPTAVPASRCGSGSITLGATPSAGETIDWFTAATNGTQIRSGVSTIDTSIVTTSITLYATARNISTGCVSAARTAVVATYNALPAAVTAVTAASNCGSGSLTLSATAPAGTTLSWFADSSTTGTALTTGLTYVTPTLSVTTKYFVASQSAAGCYAATLKSVTATINDVPGSPAVTTTQSRCGTGSITLTATAPTGSAVWFRDASTATALTTATTATVTYATPATSSSDSTYYVASKSTVGCFSARTAVVAKINPLPASPAGVPASRCGSGSITLGATPSAGETIDWFTAATNGTQIRSGVSTIDTSIVTTSITLYATARNISTGCVSAARTAVVATYNALPAAVTVVTAASNCGSGSLTLSATAPTGTTLSWFADSSTTGTALTTGLTYITPTLSVTTKYFVASQSAAGCFATTLKSVTATINDVPGSPAVTTTQSRCGTGSITLTATAPTGSAVWFRDASTATALTTATTATVTYATPATSSSDSTYYVASKSTVGCFSARTAVVAKINPLPASPAGVPASRCGSGSITLGATPSAGETIDWFTAATNGTQIRSSVSTIDTTIATTSITLGATARNISTGCVSAARTAVVATYNALPAAVTVVTAASNCGSGSLTLSATAPTGTTLSWFADSSTTGTALTTGLTYITPTLSVTTKYFVASQAAGCYTTTLKSVVATINNIPGLPAVNTTQGRCSTGTVTLTATAATGAYPVWYRTSTSTTALTTLTTTTVTYATPTTSSSDSTYYVTSKSTAGCLATSRTAVVAKINPLPAAPTATGTIICGTGRATVSASTTVTSGVIDWYSAATLGTLLRSGSNTFDSLISAAKTFYAATRVTTTGCVSAARSAATANVNSIYAASASLTGLTTICSIVGLPTTSTPYTATAITGVTTYQWTIPTGAVIDSGSTGVRIRVRFITAGANDSIYVQGKNTITGCLGTKKVLKLVTTGCATTPFAKFESTDNSFNKMSVKVSPNPTTSNFNLQVISAGQESINVRVLDLQGRVVKSLKLMPFETINLGADLKAGVYIIEVRKGNEVKTTRVVKY